MPAWFESMIEIFQNSTSDLICTFEEAALFDYIAVII